MRWFPRVLLAGALGLTAGALRAQEVEPQPAQEPLPDAPVAVTQWLAGDQQSETLRDRTVAAVLAKPTEGLGFLAARLREADAGPERNALRELTRQVVLGFIGRERKRGMVYVGQYVALAALQPFASEFLFELLLDTPQWYPLTARLQLVAPLRDLETRLPAEGRLDAIIRCVEDEREPLDLRQAMAAMLWQWGKTDYAVRFVTQLVGDTVVGDGEERVDCALRLADYYNLLRDYRKAAGAHRTAQVLAKGSGVTLRPIAWYAAACVFALNGDVERGIDALSHCVDQLASPDLDSSLRLERKLFEQDPELAALRADARFAALFAKAFPDEDGQGARNGKHVGSRAPEHGGR